VEAGFPSICAGVSSRLLARMESKWRHQSLERGEDFNEHGDLSIVIFGLVFFELPFVNLVLDECNLFFQ
jgi:hypothetical protein